MASSSDLEKFKRHPYSVSFGGVGLGPLTDEPAISISRKRLAARNYGDDGSEKDSEVITKSEATLTVRTADVEAALALVSGFSVGDDVLDAARGGALAFVPPEGSGERTLTFPNAFPLPDLDYVKNNSGYHSAKLSFIARPDASGLLFTFN